MRWNATCTLVAKTYTLDDEGVEQVVDVKTPVFCNERRMGASTWSSMYEIGISADAEIQVRSAEYQGQRDVVFNDKWYSVEVVKKEGEFTVLTLRHQQSDSADKEEGSGE